MMVDLDRGCFGMVVAKLLIVGSVVYAFGS